MYCQNCGRKIDDTAKFCPYCGSEQKRAPGQENQSGNNGEGKNPWPRGVFIGLAVIAIVVVGLFAVCAALDGDDMPVATVPKESQIETTCPDDRNADSRGWLENCRWKTLLLSRWRKVRGCSGN